MVWPQTRIARVFAIDIPIIQAPMAGGATTPELVAAVSNAGGLGSLGAGYMKADDMRSAIQRIRSLTSKPFAVNLFIPENSEVTSAQLAAMQTILQRVCQKFVKDWRPVNPPYCESFEEQIAVVIEEKVPVFSFTFGILNNHWCEKLKCNGTLLVGTATTLAEAKQLVDAGVDAIVAQGCEAGGHRGTFLGKSQDALIGNLALIPQLVDHITLPIIAAGGIMDARGIVAAKVLGASAVQMGTAFLTCPEAGIATHYKKMLLTSEADNTVLTRAFSGKFARGIKNKFTEQMMQYADQILDYPVQNALTKQLRAQANKQGLVDYCSLWAGQAAYLSQGLPAADLVKKLSDDVLTLLKSEL